MEIPEVPLEGGDRFQSLMAIMIAIVTLVGAVLAWQAAVASADAGDSDFAGMSAALNAEETLTLMNNGFHRHYRAYTSYAANSGLRDDTSSLPQTALLRQNAARVAAADRLFFPNRYVDQNGRYASQRELGETWAQASQVRDLEPAPHFAAADQARLKTNWLVGIFIGLALSLLLYTLAEGLHPERRLLRWLTAVGGTFFLLFTIVAAIIIEAQL